MQRTASVLCLAIAFTSSIVNAIACAEAPEQNLESLLAEARLAQTKGDFARAAEAYRKAVVLDPSIPELWANLGLMDHEAGNHSEAVKSLQHAARLDPSLFVPQLFLGIEYLQSNKAEAAIPYLEAAVKLNPTDIQAVGSLGEAHRMLGESDEAIELYSQAMRLNANDGSIWFDLGTSYLQRVETDARLMTSAYNDSPYVKLRSGEVLATEGKWIEAERAYKTAVASAAPLPCALAELGITLLREGETVAARQQFERELQTGYHCQLAALGLAIVDVVSGRPEGALNRLGPIATADPVFVRSSLPLFRGAVKPEQVESLIAAARTETGTFSSIDLAELIGSAFSSDDIVPAWRSADEKISTGLGAPSSSDVQRLAFEGQYSNCDQALKRDLRSEDTDNLQLLAYCSFYVADFQTTALAAQKIKKNPGTRAQGLYWDSKAGQNLAVQALSRAGEIDANSPRMHVLLGDVFRQEHHWDEAEAEYRKAVLLDPKSHSPRLNLAITLFTELKNDEALRIDESLLSENSVDPEANLLAGEILVQRNQFHEAEPYLLKCASLKPELLPRSHALLGKVYAETHRIPAAIDEYKLGLAADTDGSIYYQLARLYLKSGNKAAAEAAMRESKRLVEQANDRERNALGHIGAVVGRQ